MNVFDCIQHSPEWYAVRRGNLTASKIAAATGQRKRGTGELAARRNMRFELLSEILRDKTTDHYVSPYMDWGIEQEPRARAEYEIRTGQSVEPLGFIFHPTLDRCGASPDGYIAPNGLLEIKCPETHNHLEYIDSGIVPVEYVPQMAWQMACAGPEIEYVDFVSFDPRLVEELQLFVIRYERDDKRIAEMEEQAIEFLSEVAQMAERLKVNAKLPTLEDKLRESVRQAKGYHPEESELYITESDIA